MENINTEEIDTEKTKEDVDVQPTEEGVAIGEEKEPLSDEQIEELENTLKHIEQLKDTLNAQMKLRPSIAMSTEFFKLIEHITVIKRSLGRDLSDSLTNLKALLPEHLRKLDLEEEYVKILKQESFRSRSEKKLIRSYMFITAARKVDAMQRAKQDKESEDADTTVEKIESQDSEPPVEVGVENAGMDEHVSDSNN